MVNFVIDWDLMGISLKTNINYYITEYILIFVIFDFFIEISRHLRNFIKGIDFGNGVLNILVLLIQPATLY